MTTVKEKLQRSQLVKQYGAAMDAMREYVGGTHSGSNDGSLHQIYWAAVEAAEQAIRDDIDEKERRAAWPNDAFKMAVRGKV